MKKKLVGFKEFKGILEMANIEIDYADLLFQIERAYMFDADQTKGTSLEIEYAEKWHTIHDELKARGFFNFGIQ